MRLLSNKDAQFFIACILEILAELHDKKIIHRDVKPENFVVDENGYLKLVDLSIAKVVHNRTYTITGTPHYMAPEVLSGQGYNHSADLWSLGIILYEFIMGSVPFGDSLEDPY